MANKKTYVLCYKVGKSTSELAVTQIYSSIINYLIDKFGDLKEAEKNGYYIDVKD